MSNVHSFRVASRLGLIATICLGLVATVQVLTREQIETSRTTFANSLLYEVLGAPDYTLTPGDGENTWSYAAPGITGSLFQAHTADGYSGDITFWIALDDIGMIRGVRIVSHRETPGLGDKIEWPRSDWIEDFRGTRIDGNLRFDVRRAGGDFDAFAGATITPRAVVRGVYRAVAERLSKPVSLREPAVYRAVAERLSKPVSLREPATFTSTLTKAP